MSTNLWRIVVLQQIFHNCRDFSESKSTMVEKTDRGNEYYMFEHEIFLIYVSLSTSNVSIKKSGQHNWKPLISNTVKVAIYALGKFSLVTR